MPMKNICEFSHYFIINNGNVENMSSIFILFIFFFNQYFCIDKYVYMLVWAVYILYFNSSLLIETWVQQIKSPEREKDITLMWMVNFLALYRGSNDMSFRVETITITFLDWLNLFSFYCSLLFFLPLLLTFLSPIPLCLPAVNLIVIKKKTEIHN